MQACTAIIPRSRVAVSACCPLVGYGAKMARALKARCCFCARFAAFRTRRAPPSPGAFKVCSLNARKPSSYSIGDASLALASGAMDELGVIAALFKMPAPPSAFVAASTLRVAPRVQARPLTLIRAWVHCFAGALYCRCTVMFHSCERCSHAKQ